MMISPLHYYVYALRGRSEQTLKRKIRTLKAGIRELEQAIEEGTAAPIDPGPDVQIGMLGEYLEVAQAELVFKKYGIH